MADLAKDDRTELQIDPQLRELFLRLTGNTLSSAGVEEAADQIVPVVARLRDPNEPVPGLGIVCRFETIVTGRVALSDLVGVRLHRNVASLKASQLYSRELAVSVPEIHADAASLRAAAPQGVTGRRVIIGIADWGCDFGHANFRNPDGTTRIRCIWDQRGKSRSAPAPYGYGREITREQINAALASIDPYGHLGYDSAEIDGAGYGTHGTHVMDIAAGNGAAPGSAPGVAPEAEFVFVHMMGNDTDPRDTLGDSVRLLEAVHYIRERADGGPCVLNLSLGRTGGPKDGSTLVEQALDEMLRSTPGCAAVMSTGNYRVAAQHASGRLGQGEVVELPWRLMARNEEIAELEVWYRGSDRIAAELVDPFGHVKARASPGEEYVCREGGEVVATIYNRTGDPNNGDCQIDGFLWPRAAIGTWHLRLAGLEVNDGTYHAYIERDDPEFQSRFLPEFASRQGTTNTICNGRLTIAVGAYDARVTGRPPVEFSSEGPTRDGRLKPDCAAPGAGIRAARSSWPAGEWRTTDALTVKSGTSMAAPHVTGTVALMFEAALPYRMPVEVTRELLFRACRAPTGAESDPTRYGAGMVDAAESVRLASLWKMQQARGAARANRRPRPESEDIHVALIDSVKKICDRLAPQGWRDLLMKHGLDIRAADLAKELAKPLPKIDRTIAGFEDFALEGSRGIEGGQPARSLLYHALASGGVTKGAGGGDLKAFPTWAEINTVENLVFATRRVSLDDLKREYGADLAVVVFAVEYRSLTRSVHRRHADLAFARCGVARVGTEEARYLPDLRSYTPLSRSNPHAVCVTPARYAAFVAVRRKGVRDQLPEHFQSGDDSREFWLPVHKLFSGAECLKGMDLKISMKMCHYNEKLKRLRVALGQTSGVDLDKPPFTLTDGIASWGNERTFGPGVVVPQPRKRLVDYAKDAAGKHVTFKVDRTKLPGGPIWASLGAATRRDSDRNLLRSAPEWIHVRFIPKGSSVADQSDRTDEDIETIVGTGNYNAVHLLDYSGEGWIEAGIAALAGLKSLPAYSMVAAPDFFPFCDQLQLTEWADGLGRVRSIWDIPPRPLSDNRMPFNLQVPGNPFSPTDKTGTAVVSMPYASLPKKAGTTARRRAISWLPDAAAGVHAPGWDVSLDSQAAVTHLANYGLGSPFPEDAHLCAALSAFWPGVAPDTARKFEPMGQYTVAPLTDEELGHGTTVGFDGHPGPRIVTSGSTRAVEFPRGAYTDYVKSALENKYNFHLTAKVGITEYKNRILAMLRAYDQVKAVTEDDKKRWSVFSFRKVTGSDAEFQSAQRGAGNTRVDEPIYRIHMVQLKAARPKKAERVVRHEITTERIFYLNPLAASGQLLEGRVASVAATAASAAVAAGAGGAVGRR